MVFHPHVGCSKLQLTASMNTTPSSILTLRPIIYISLVCSIIPYKFHPCWCPNASSCSSSRFYPLDPTPPPRRDRLSCISARADKVASTLSSVVLAASPRASRVWFRLSEPQTRDSSATADAKPNGENKMLCCCRSAAALVAKVRYGSKAKAVFRVNELSC